MPPMTGGVQKQRNQLWRDLTLLCVFISYEDKHRKAAEGTVEPVDRNMHQSERSRDSGRENENGPHLSYLPDPSFQIRLVPNPRVTFIYWHTQRTRTTSAGGQARLMVTCKPGGGTLPWNTTDNAS